MNKNGHILQNEYFDHILKIAIKKTKKKQKRNP